MSVTSTCLLLNLQIWIASSVRFNHLHNEYMSFYTLYILVLIDKKLYMKWPL